MNLKHTFAVAFAMLLGTQFASAQTPILTELCELAPEINETSGLENGPNGWFWTHNDSGNSAELFCVDTLGVIQRTVAVIGDTNVDWEEIAKDAEGNLYIGNFGNNVLKRTDLRITKIPSIDTCTTTAQVTDTIWFSYPDQTSFPPVGSYGNFDMEAFFHYQESLHLFSKDRSDPSTGYTKHYTLPAVGGTYVAQLVDSFHAGHANFVFAVTAADISEDGSQMVLLSSNKIWLFRNFSGTDFFGGDVSELALDVFSQKEGICFRDGFLYITDEKSFGLGGKMYRLHPDVFVSVAEQPNQLHVKTVYDATRRLQEIQFNNNGRYAWELVTTDGKLLQKGVAVDTLRASEFHQKAGMYIIRFSSKTAEISMLLRL